MLHRKGDNERGAVLLIGAFFALALVMVGISVANVGLMVAEKIQVQDSVDASAYSAGVVQARYMNLSAYVNRAMIANYNSMAFNTALWSTIAAHDHGLANGIAMLYALTVVIEGVSLGIATPIALQIDALADVLRDPAHSFLHDFNSELDTTFGQTDDDRDLNRFIEIYNTDVLSQYQGLLYAAMQSARHEVVQSVASEVDPEVRTSTLLGLGAETVSYDELERAVDYVVDTNERQGFFGLLTRRFDELMGNDPTSDDHPYLLGALTEVSLDPFTAGRDRSGTPNILRQFNVGDIIGGIVGPIETGLEVACRATIVGNLFDCNTDIRLDLGAVVRDGQEDEADQEHVPVIASQRMREVNGWIFRLQISGLPGVTQTLENLQGNSGYTSGDRRNDIANAANATVCAEYASSFSLRRFNESISAGTAAAAPGQIPARGLNVLNMRLGSIMGITPPALCDDHWDGTLDQKPVHFAEIFPPGFGQAEAGLYAAATAANLGTEEGVPNYDWRTNLNGVGIPHYFYDTAGAARRPAGNSRGDSENFLTGPSIAVVGIKRVEDINGLFGLGIGNDYPITAIARAQVYYLRNPNRPDERPSLFNPHWVARLAPIDSDDTPRLLREGIPFVSSSGIPIRPTH